MYSAEQILYIPFDFDRRIDYFYISIYHLMSQSTCKQLNAIVATDMVLSISTSTLQLLSTRPILLTFYKTATLGYCLFTH